MKKTKETAGFSQFVAHEDLIHRLEIIAGYWDFRCTETDNIRQAIRDLRSGRNPDPGLYMVACGCDLECPVKIQDPRTHTWTPRRPYLGALIDLADFQVRAWQINLCGCDVQAMIRTLPYAPHVVFGCGADVLDAEEYLSGGTLLVLLSRNHLFGAQKKIKEYAEALDRNCIREYRLGENYRRQPASLPMLNNIIVEAALLLPGDDQPIKK